MDWHDANRAYLAAAVAAVAAALERHAGGDPAEPSAPAAVVDPAPPALDSLCAAFGLSAFERDLLVLCAGMELDPGLAARCAAAQEPPRAYPTFGLALAALPEPHWSALSPAAPLRRWRLVEVGGAETLTGAPLRIDERVLHYLVGVPHLDERLAGLVEQVESPPEPPASQSALARRLAAVWTRHEAAPLVVELCGDDVATRREVAAAACAAVGIRLHALWASDLPASAAERESLARLWEREAVLSSSALLVEWDGESAEAVAAARAFVERVRSVVLVAGREPLRLRAAGAVRFDVARPSTAEQEELWRSVLGPAAAAANGQVDAVVSQFDLAPHLIRAAGADALARVDGDLAEGALWEACRLQARPRLDDLAQRIEPAAGWDDVVLPQRQQALLREIAVHLRRRALVYGAWGFAARSSRGLGISALFAGPSGTGKTMAAEVLARELSLDLYRIDLSSVVSKYIGETEKNLRRVFDAAELGGAILLFDEADALFGKRSEVRDSHDRYANIEVSYLLQRMEAYRGLAILTTNMKGALDAAFLRRLRFVVSFPFPGPAERAEIWRRVFPPETPTDGLDAAKLGRLVVAGGNIRNIALAAAFLAADEGAPVRMGHLLRAAQGELAKLEKPLTEAEVGGWI